MPRIKEGRHNKIPLNVSLSTDKSKLTSANKPSSKNGNSMSTSRSFPESTSFTSKDEDTFIFGNIKFGEDVLLHPKKKGPHQKDFKSHLKLVEKRLTKLHQLSIIDSKVFASTKNNYAWNKSLKQVKGEKVKDDLHLLTKSIKKKEKIKERRKKAWKEKENRVQKEMKERQRQRQKNLEERKSQKKKGKRR
ncbi:hypothetical protein HMI54_001023 [Coelomomyces lativittatus]|nr:hypothetical protein HMI56_006766 [Coelomomyces lativittatus]KAJ1517662.1 hypothetical protein HMI55_006372 [Coelomomyces lativittatus]KAJ1518372.1 hypothetical protein HMI54_001023 [Coelomomyces lativittatus]